MKDESKGIALVILGIVAVIAIVGLVLMFVKGDKATGEGIYGGAIKQNPAPLWTTRGVPIGGQEELFGEGLRQASTHWNYQGKPKRGFYGEGFAPGGGDVPSLQTACPTMANGNNGIRVSYGQNGLLDYYEDVRGMTCIDSTQPGKCCYLPGDLSMVDNGYPYQPLGAVLS